MRGNYMIPKDPIILLSFINTQLRDNYSNLENMAEGLDIGKDELQDICTKLEGVGYKYDAERNQFI